VCVCGVVCVWELRCRDVEGVVGQTRASHATGEICDCSTSGMCAALQSLWWCDAELHMRVNLALLHADVQFVSVARRCGVFCSSDAERLVLRSLARNKRGARAGTCAAHGPCKGRCNSHTHISGVLLHTGVRFVRVACRCTLMNAQATRTFSSLAERKLTVFAGVSFSTIQRSPSRTAAIF